MPPTADYLFVYGTLGRNAQHEMHGHLIRNADDAGEGTFNGILYRLAHYPGAVASDRPGDIVHGELYRLRDAAEVFRHLDPYEGCGPHDPTPRQYVREIKPIRRADGMQVQAWIYIYNRDVTNLARIASGRFSAP
jgi:gamma-glutamylcyclotransferase (GGCT)/AIG2-like uncharacterized protein YtfP